MTFIKKILYTLLILIISTGIFFIIENDRNVKEDILSKTLELFGQQLFAMVPEGAQKVVLKKQYEDFVRKAKNREIPPQQIEQVAVSILNMTSQDTIRNAEEILLELELDSLLENLDTTPQVPARPPSIHKKSLLPQLPLASKKEDNFRELAQRLRRMYDFHDQLQRLVVAQKLPEKVYQEILFSADSTLRIEIRGDLRRLFRERNLLSLEKQLERLEKEGLVAWAPSHGLLQIDGFRESMKAAMEALNGVKIIINDSTIIFQKDSLKKVIKENRN